MSEQLLQEMKDIRMRIWIPYSLKYGLGESILHEKPNEDQFPLPNTYEWVEFVAVNDPLTDEPCPDCIVVKATQAGKYYHCPTCDTVEDSLEELKEYMERQGWSFSPPKEDEHE